MKYKRVKVFGVYRSGTHYISALVAKNFFNTENYLHFYSGHSHHHIESKDTLNIYIHRNFEDTAKSLFVIRKRMGIKTDDYNVFLNSKLSCLWTNKIDSEIKTNFLVRKGIRNEICKDFSKKNITFKDFWSKHVKFWLGKSKSIDNILVVRYEDLLENFHETMMIIANKLGSDKTEFVNIKEKVGWFV